MITGVYQIRNLINGSRYIGSAAGIAGFSHRWTCHRSELELKKHANRHLQNAWSKYGQSAFVFEVILHCDPQDCLIYEQMALDTVKPEYNICPQANNSLGFRHSEESKRKMSLAQQGRKHSVDHRAKVGKASQERQRGAMNSYAKLTENGVRRIKQLLRQGMNHRMIANQFDVTRACISQINIGKSWSHI